MKKFFISPLFCLALVLVLPSSIVADKKSQKSDESSESDKCGCSKPPVREDSEKKDAQMDLDENLNELSEFIARLSILDENPASPIHRLNKQIKNGNSVVLRK